MYYLYIKSLPCSLLSQAIGLDTRNLWPNYVTISVGYQTIFQVYIYYIHNRRATKIFFSTTFWHPAGISSSVRTILSTYASVPSNPYHSAVLNTYDDKIVRWTSANVFNKSRNFDTLKIQNSCIVHDSDDFPC